MPCPRDFPLPDHGAVVGLGELSAGGKGLGWGWDLGHSHHEHDFWHLSYKCVMSSS